MAHRNEICPLARSRLASQGPLPDAEMLMADALRRARRPRFSDPSFAEPLRRLLQSCDEEAALSAFGRHALRFDLMRCLANLLRFDAAEEEDPAILARPIARPVFITGMPRSATTFLHSLLALDPANAAPRCWQTIYPYPARPRPFGADFRRPRVALQLRLFRLFSPGVGELHELAADTPQECTDITAQVFQSARFETIHHIPSYQAWLDQHGHHAAFRFHKRFLQHLDAQSGGRPGGRWVLKSPDHVFALEAIRAVYPDARFVFLHRDPLSVLASCAKLVERLRRPFTRRIDRAEIGRQVSARLAESAERMMRFAARSRGDLHLQYREVIARPLQAVRRLYDHCGMELGAEAEARMAAFLARPRGRAGHSYSMAEFALDAPDLRARFAPYVEAFGIDGEWRGERSSGIVRDRAA